MTNHTHAPLSEDPDDVQRRGFLKGLCFTFLGFMSAAMAWPFVSYLLPLSNEGGESKFIKVPNFPAIPTGTPSKMTFEQLDIDTFLRSTKVFDLWVIKHTPTEATVYSPLCPHLNCRYTWENKQFNCPCHGSLFDEKGKVTGGPSPRPLDTLPYKVEGGELYVKWKVYKAGIPEKVEA